MGESRYLPERQNHVCRCQARQGQEGGGCRRCWQVGSRKLQAARQGAQGKEARCQEGQEAGKEGSQAKGRQEARSQEGKEARSQEGKEARQEGRPQEEVNLRPAISSSIII